MENRVLSGAVHIERLTNYPKIRMEGQRERRVRIRTKQGDVAINLILLASIALLLGYVYADAWGYLS